MDDIHEVAQRQLDRTRIQRTDAIALAIRYYSELPPQPLLGRNEDTPPTISEVLDVALKFNDFIAELAIPDQLRR